jgi:hypothetical protein
MKHPKLRVAFLFLLITFSIPTFAQKHSISITPLRPLFRKFNLRYEYAVKSNLTITLEFEDWNIKDKPKFTLSDDNPNERTHVGNRFNIGIRKYDISKIKERSTNYSFIGVGSFIGKHKVGLRTFTPKPLDGYTIRSGNVSLITTGVRVDVGIRKIFKKGYFFEFGIFGGYAWNNKKQKKLMLFDEEQIREPEEKKLIGDVGGLFYSTVFLVGYNF